jgi:hypothetical protein
LVLGIWYWRGSAHQSRQTELADALRIRDAVLTVTPQPDDPRPHFPNKDAKDKAVRAAFEGIISRHPGSDESAVAHFHLGSLDSDNGDIANAEKHFKIVVESGDADLASSGKLSLAQVYQAQGKNADAERLLRELINNPTTVVSKEQATFSLIRLLGVTNPSEARKLLEPLQKDERAAINRNAASLAAELPVQASAAPGK